MGTRPSEVPTRPWEKTPAETKVFTVDLLVSEPDAARLDAIEMAARQRNLNCQRKPAFTKPNTQFVPERLIVFCEPEVWDKVLAEAGPLLVAVRIANLQHSMGCM